MAETFTWLPRADPDGEFTFATRAVQFGDGYSQAVGEGINTQAQSWPLTFSGKAAYIAPIKAFLEARGGHESFLWTPPLGTAGYYRCTGFRLRDRGADRYVLTATFQQVFQP